MTGAMTVIRRLPLPVRQRLAAFRIGATRGYASLMSAVIRTAPVRARAIVRAATHYKDPKVLLEVSEDLTGMKGLAVGAMDAAQMLQTRGW